MIKILVALPCYNEEGNIESLLRRFIEFNKTAKDLHLDVLVIDDGSKDNTKKLAENYLSKMPLRVLTHQTNKGLDGVLKTSFEEFYKSIHAAQGYSAFALMDGDDSHPPEFITSMWNKLSSQKLDVVIASRFRKGAKIHGVVWWRQVLSFGMAMLFKSFRNMKGVMDYSCGYRVYSPQIIDKMIRYYGREVVSQHNFSCMVELLRNCYDLGAKCGEVPFVLRYDLKKGPSKMQFYKTIKGTLKVLLETRGSHRLPDKNTSVRLDS